MPFWIVGSHNCQTDKPPPLKTENHGILITMGFLLLTLQGSVDTWWVGCCSERRQTLFRPTGHRNNVWKRSLASCFRRECIIHALLGKSMHLPVQNNPCTTQRICCCKQLFPVSDVAWRATSVSRKCSQSFQPGTRRVPPTVLQPRAPSPPFIPLSFLCPDKTIDYPEQCQRVTSAPVLWDAPN